MSAQEATPLTNWITLTIAHIIYLSIFRLSQTIETSSLNPSHSRSLALRNTTTNPKTWSLDPLYLWVARTLESRRVKVHAKFISTEQTPIVVPYIHIVYTFVLYWFECHKRLLALFVSCCHTVCVRNVYNVSVLSTTPSAHPVIRLSQPTDMRLGGGPARDIEREREAGKGRGQWMMVIMSCVVLNSTLWTHTAGRDSEGMV